MLNCGKYSELLVVLISKITPRLDWALRRPSMKSLKLTEPLIIVSCDCDYWHSDWNATARGSTS